MNFGIATVGVITVLCYLVGLGVHASKIDNKYIPVTVGVAGTILGIIALYTGMPDFPAIDPVTAGAVGAASGFAATGIDQLVKQFKNGKSTDTTDETAVG